MTQLRIFIGYDPRQPVAFTVLAHSIWKRASKPVQIIRLQLNQLPIKRIGLTAFTYSRYLVPFLCDYRGEAIFMDADMLCLTDIWQLEEICYPQISSVCVVPHSRKFERPSLMYFNNAHCQRLTLKEIEEGTPQSLSWATSIGEIPHEWNHLVMYDEPRKDAKIVHFTAGIPCWPETGSCEYAAEWRADAEECYGSVSWQELMGNSVHADMVKASAAA